MSDEKILSAGFDHPCRETCSGWQQGRERGVFDSKKDLEAEVVRTEWLEGALKEQRRQHNIEYQRACTLDIKWAECEARANDHFKEMADLRRSLHAAIDVISIDLSHHYLSWTWFKALGLPVPAELEYQIPEQEKLK